MGIPVGVYDLEQGGALSCNTDCNKGPSYSCFVLSSEGPHADMKYSFVFINHYLDQIHEIYIYETHGRNVDDSFRTQSHYMISFHP